MANSIEGNCRRRARPVARVGACLSRVARLQRHAFVFAEFHAAALASRLASQGAQAVEADKPLCPTSAAQARRAKRSSARKRRGSWREERARENERARRPEHPRRRCALLLLCILGPEPYNPRGSSVNGVGRVHFGVYFCAFWSQNPVPQSAGLLGRRCRKGAFWGVFLGILGPEPCATIRGAPR